MHNLVFLFAQTGRVLWISFCTFMSLVNIPDPNWTPTPSITVRPIPNRMLYCNVNCIVMSWGLKTLKCCSYKNDWYLQDASCSNDNLVMISFGKWCGKYCLQNIYYITCFICNVWFPTLVSSQYQNSVDFKSTTSLTIIQSWSPSVQIISSRCNYV